MTYLGLYAQQHRGQEGAGIVSLHEGKHILKKGFGEVGAVFSEDKLQTLKGEAAIGHVRYSTSGKKEDTLHDIQPLGGEIAAGPFYFAHNGNILNAETLKKRLKEKGSLFRGTSDSEILIHLVAQSPYEDILTSLKKTLPLLKGAYNFVILLKDRLVAVRDPLGMRPLVLGKRSLQNGRTSYVVASESCAFDLIGAQLVREIEPGEIFSVGKEGERSETFASSTRKARCVFEHVYFSRPDSFVFGSSVYESRKKMGRQLAKESFVDADVVIPVPDSGVPAALGFSQESKIPYEMGIVRNHYVGRTFIQPSQSIRSFGVKIKLNPQACVLKGKKVVVVDDSLVRGTTSRKIVRILRQFGAKEVHFRVSSPPIISPCYYGIDTPSEEELIASQKTSKQIKEYIGADSLHYLSEEGLRECVFPNKEHCFACFNKKYPILEKKEDVEKASWDLS